MFLTEDEAKTKWCPFARVIVQRDGVQIAGPANINLILDGDDGTAEYRKCIGSACMAWRWLKKYEFAKGTDDVKPDGDGWEWDTFSDNGWERWVVSTDSFCGLAGKPE